MKSAAFPHRLRSIGRRATSGLRVLPDFVIIGGQRCGSTSLFAHIGGHPRVAPARYKELQFFSNRYSRGESWYRSHFPMGVSLRRSGSITGEASPEYLVHRGTAERAAQLVPDAKLIVLLRNPTARLYSHFKLHTSLGRERRTIEAVVDYELNDAALSTGLHHPVPLSGDGFRIRYPYLSGGRYMDHLRSWLDAFPPDRLLILCSEEYFSDPAATLQSVTDFLELPFARIDAPKLNAQRYSPLTRAAKSALDDFYRSHNKALYEYLGRDLGWS